MKQSGFGITSLILGILGFLGSCFILGIISFWNAAVAFSLFTWPPSTNSSTFISYFANSSFHLYKPTPYLSWLA